MAFEKVSLVNRDGHRLAGRLDLPPDGRPLAYALFAHCFTCTKNLKAVGHISRALTQQGIAVLRFDFTGLGECEGDFADTNLSSNVEDLVEMAGLLAREREAPRILIGHSLGGAAVIRAAARIGSVRAVASIGAPHDPRHVAHVFGASLATIEASGEARVTLAGRPFRSHGDRRALPGPPDAHRRRDPGGHATSPTRAIGVIAPETLSCAH